MYILIIAEYILCVPDSIARLPGPAGLLSSDQPPAHALNQLTLKHWQLQVYSLLLGNTLACTPWARERVTCWGIQLMRVSFTQLAATMMSGLLTSSTSTSPRCSARGEWAWELEGLGLFNIQAILQVQRFHQK